MESIDELPRAYTRSALDERYRGLFDEILLSVTSGRKNEQTKSVYSDPSKNVAEAGAAVFDRDLFYDFVGSVPNSEKNNFKKNLSSLAQIPTSTWRQMSLNGLPGLVRAERAFCLSAYANKQHIADRLASYLSHCKDKGANLYGARNHQGLVDELIATYQSSSKKKPEENSLIWNTDSSYFSADLPSDSLSIPDHSENLSWDTVISSLCWDCKITKMVGRDRELELLDDWLNSKPKASIKIIEGGAGVGKTRLAFEFASTAENNGWAAGCVDLNSSHSWRVGTKGVLIIIDYPEESPEVVRSFVSSIKIMQEHKKKIRIILLTRNASAAERICNSSKSLLAPHLRVKELSSDEDAWGLVTSSLECFYLIKGGKPDLAIELGKMVSFEDFKSWKEIHDSHSRPLILISYALYIFASEAEGISTQPSPSIKTILKFICDREIRRIENEIYSATSRIDYRGSCLLLAVTAITGGLNAFEVEEIHKSFNQTTCAPPNSQDVRALTYWENDRIAPIVPDLLAAEFLAECIEQFAGALIFEWVVLIIFICSSEDGLPVRTVMERAIRLSRLLEDHAYINSHSTHANENSELSLDWSWPIDSMGSRFKSYPYFADIFCKIPASEAGYRPHLRSLLSAALEATLDTESDLGRLLMHSIERSSLFLSGAQYSECIIECYRAQSIFRNIDNAALSNLTDLIASYFNQAIAFSVLGDFEESFRASRFAACLLYTSPSPRDLSTSRMPSSA